MSQHEYDAVIGITDPNDPNILEVRIKFCTCDGTLKQDKRIHNVAEMYQFMAIHCQEVANNHGNITWEYLTMGILAYPIQQNHMHMVPAQGLPPEHRYTMLVSVQSRLDYWPSIEVQDRDRINNVYDTSHDLMLDALRNIGMQVYSFDEGGLHRM